MTASTELVGLPFDLVHAREVLQRTPATLSAMLAGISPAWHDATEGGETWSPYTVIGHLNHGERTDWIPRARMILEHGTSRTFDPFDRLAQFHESAGKTLDELLTEFATLRAESLAALDAMALTHDDLARRGRHPAFGEVTLSQLLSCWVAHDLGHIVQVSRTMARQYREAVGPWRAYLSVMAR